MRKMRSGMGRSRSTVKPDGISDNSERGSRTGHGKQSGSCQYGHSSRIVHRPAPKLRKNRSVPIHTLERLRDLIAFSAVDAVYVHAPDRLARSYAHQVLLLEEFSRAGTQMVFLNRPIGDTPEDSLLLQLQGMFAEYERAKMLERSRRGKRHRAQAGAVSVLARAP